MKDLFGNEVTQQPTPPRKGGRPSRKYLVTVRLQQGRHPHTGLPLLQPAGETCGSCDHFRRWASRGSRRWFKCALTPGGHEATDIRAKWPACEKWKKMETTVPHG